MVGLNVYDVVFLDILMCNG